MDSERISDAALAQAFRDWAERLIHKTPSICTEAVEYGDMVREYVYSRARELDALEQREAATLNELSGNSGQLATPPRDVPEGFVVVPRVPTEAMIAAGWGRNYRLETGLGRAIAEGQYQGLLAAAPSGEVG